MVLLLWIICVISVLSLLCVRACLFIGALWSSALKGLTSWLSFVMSYCVCHLCVVLDCIDPDLCPLSYFKYEKRIVHKCYMTVGMYGY